MQRALARTGLGGRGELLALQQVDQPGVGDGEPVAWNVAGPTCDSVDVVMREELFPADLQEGDLIFIKNAGAYTTAYASNFNGFPLPEVATLSG